MAGPVQLPGAAADIGCALVMQQPEDRRNFRESLYDDASLGGVQPRRRGIVHAKLFRALLGMT